MANQFSGLMRMLETRIARQKQALADSELQLAATRESYLKVEEQNAAKPSPQAELGYDVPAKRK